MLTIGEIHDHLDEIEISPKIFMGIHRQPRYRPVARIVNLETQIADGPLRRAELCEFR